MHHGSKAKLRIVLEDWDSSADQPEVKECIAAQSQRFLVEHANA